MRVALFHFVLLACLWPAICAAQETAPKSGADTGPVHAVVDLDDGSRLVGLMPADFTFPVQSADLKANVAIKMVRSITMLNDRKSAVIIMQNDDRLAGVLSVQSLPLKMGIGDLQLDLQHIKSVSVFGSAEAAEPGLVFWNTLASEAEALHSAAGPALVPYKNDGNPGAAESGREFISGNRGSAITIKGTYKSEQSVRNLVLDHLDKLIDPEKGCIELWYYQVARPVDYSYGIYRLFDGDYGLDGPVQFCTLSYGVQFTILCGAEQGTGQTVRIPLEKVPEREWVHLAAVWNRKGIDGTKETIRLYLNGKEVASSNATNWGTNAAGRADICGANDDQCAGKFLMNNLKIWNQDRTNFDLDKKPDITPKNMPAAVPPPPDDPDAG